MGRKKEFGTVAAAAAFIFFIAAVIFWRMNGVDRGGFPHAGVPEGATVSMVDMGCLYGKLTAAVERLRRADTAFSVASVVAVDVLKHYPADEETVARVMLEYQVSAAVWNVRSRELFSQLLYIQYLLQSHRMVSHPLHRQGLQAFCGGALAELYSEAGIHMFEEGVIDRLRSHRQHRPLPFSTSLAAGPGRFFLRDILTRP